MEQQEEARIKQTKKQGETRTNMKKQEETGINYKIQEVIRRNRTN